MPEKPVSRRSFFSNMPFLQRISVEVFGCLQAGKPFTVLETVSGRDLQTSANVEVVIFVMSQLY